MRSKQIMAAAAVAILIVSAAVVESFRLSSICAVGTGDIWWHLSTGLWILRHHALPQHGIYSQSSGNSWIATSWGYELLLGILYRWFGLRAIPILYMGFKALLALITFLLAGGWRGRLIPAIVLSGCVQIALFIVPAGPANASILLLALELLLLAESRRRADARWLYWLPVLFLVWANLDVQFVYGIVVLLLMLAVSAAAAIGRKLGFELSKQEPPSTRLRTLVMISALCLAATLVTPYFFRPYESFWAMTTSAANPYLGNFLSMRFRDVQDYLAMLLAMFAFLALGMRHTRSLFPILLLSGCAAWSFHSQRDAWLVVIAANALIGEAIGGEERPAEESTRHLRRRVMLWGLGSSAVIFCFVLLLLPGRRGLLLERASATYPVKACNFIREHRLERPIFNAAEWGGFLTYYLPEYPVAIDSRTSLYGDAAMIQYAKVMSASAPPDSYEAFARAKTILLPKKSVIGEAFMNMPSFKVVYSDSVSEVLSRVPPRGE